MPLQERHDRLREAEPVEFPHSRHQLQALAANRQPAARLQGLAGARLAQGGALVLDAFDEQLNRPATVLDTLQPGRNHLGVVDHHEVVGAEQLRPVRHGPVGHPNPA